MDCTLLTDIQATHQFSDWNKISFESNPSSVSSNNAFECILGKYILNKRMEF